jgi:hypothetical protein
MTSATTAGAPSRTRVVRLLLVALAALGVAWVLTPHAVPLYDGVGFPDEPYRYAAPPAGAKQTPAPTTATGVAVIQHGVNVYPFYVATKEQGPQFSMLVPDHVIAVVGSATKVDVVATPRAADGQPPGRTIDGNVYRVTAAAGGGASRATFLAGATPATVQLRATTARQPGPSFVFRPVGGQWRELKTVRAGTDVYSTTAPGFGDYALAFAPKGSDGGGGASKTGAGSGAATFAVVGGVVLGVMAAVLVAIRLSRRRANP